MGKRKKFKLGKCKRCNGKGTDPGTHALEDCLVEAMAGERKLAIFVTRKTLVLTVFDNEDGMRSYRRSLEGVDRREALKDAAEEACCDT